MEQAITDAEARVVELERTLSDPELFRSRGAEVPQLVAALEGARQAVERLYGRWQELEAIASGGGR
jgi:ATP-binding cassette subfamily F protein uup